MSQTLQEVSAAQRDALAVLSKTALDQEIARSQAVANENPAIGALLRSQPASKCGCLPQEQACGYFCIFSQGCGCGSGYFWVTGGPVSIGARNVSFNGSGRDYQPNSIDMKNVYFSGLLPPAQSLQGLLVRLHVEITPYSGTIFVYENQTPIGTLTAHTQYAGFAGARYFSGDVYGQFNLA